MPPVLSTEIIENEIYILRGQKIVLDRYLARLYGVTTTRFNESVRRNISRFPEEFALQLTKDEFANLISQIATSSWGGIRKEPIAFTEHGIAMLSGVLRSERAIAVNIQIIKAFICLRNAALEHSDLRLRIDFLEKQYDEQFKIVFDALRQTIDDDTERNHIGFREEK